MSSHDRPLSPHLQVYRLAFGTVLSGLHRIAGLMLSAGSLLLVAWLVAVARGPDAYLAASRFFSNLFVQLVLLAALGSFWYHLFAGLRHLAWDAGFGFEKSTAKKSGVAILALALVASMTTLALAWRFLPVPR